MRNWPKVVAIGGGTGLSTLLRELKNYPLHLSAIVTMTDNGASSGRLNRQTGVLPPGDIRQCLASLAVDESLVTKIFQYRFKDGHGLSGHSLGNLLLLALSDITGNFDKAVEAASRLLSIKGTVIPSTLDPASLIAYAKNGQMILGECDLPIIGHKHGIDKVAIVPEKIKANKNAINFINNADIIIVGPGSLYTSIIPNFLVKDIKKAVEKSKALKVYVCNISTERGETEHYSVEDHVRTLGKYLSIKDFKAILVNNKQLKTGNGEGKLGTVINISTDAQTICSVKIIKKDIINQNKPLYHDSKKLAKTIWELALEE